MQKKLSLLLKSNLFENISKGLAFQIVSIVASLVTVPIVLAYLGAEHYGIWVVIYSVLGIVSSCDLGLPSSFRNLLTNSVAINDTASSKKIVSTCYVSFLLVSFLILALMLIQPLESMSGIYKNMPHQAVLGIVAIALLDYNARLTLIVFTAHQQSHVMQFGTAITNIIYLATVSILTMLEIGDENTKLLIIIFTLPFISLAVNSSVTIYAFTKTFKAVRPSISSFTMIYVKPLFSSGTQFFIIQLCMAVLGQYSVILIFNLSSGDIVAGLSIYEKYFGIVSILSAALLFPFWSKFGEKYALGDYLWIKATLFKLEIFVALLSIATFFLWLIFPYVAKVWLPSGEIVLDPIIGAWVAYKYLAIVINAVYSYLLNGIGKISIQVMGYVVAALALPAAAPYLFEIYGPGGIVAYTGTMYILIAAAQKFYIKTHLMSVAIE